MSLREEERPTLEYQLPAVRHAWRGERPGRDALYMAVAVVCVDAMIYVASMRVQIPDLVLILGGSAFVGIHLVLNGFGLFGAILGLRRGPVERGNALAAFGLQFVDIVALIVAGVLVLND